MQGWSKGKKVLAGLGSLFVIGTIINAANPPDKTVVNQNKNTGSSLQQAEKSPIVTVPAPAPKTDPAPTPQPQPAPAPVAPTPTPTPAPQPQANGCDPNYSGCVPIASDVDCEGGSGNGPAYVAGPVRVIGRDIYGLDRDGDGLACE